MSEQEHIPLTIDLTKKTLIGKNSWVPVRDDKKRVVFLIKEVDGSFDHAALIVRACNSHEALVEALVEAQRLINYTPVKIAAALSRAKGESEEEYL